MAQQAQQKQPHCSLAWLLSKSFPDIYMGINNDAMTLFSNTYVSGMTLDSRVIQPGELFVALQGALSDGRLFIDDAVKAGAIVVLSETTEQTEHGQISQIDETIIIKIFKLNQCLSFISMQFYFPESECHKITAVTGTNGKTTIASLLANSYILLKQQSAQMGTIGNGLYGQLKTSLNTTLDAISVCRELRSYQNQGAQQTIMEVSSHGLVQGRVKAIPFTTAIFTNLTRDHLDYHGTMQEYANAKKKLFEDFSIQNKIINADDAIGKAWLKDYPDAIAYGFNAQQSSSQCYFKITKVDYLAQGLTFDFESSWGKNTIEAPLYGDFNVSNIAAVSCALLADGFKVEQIQEVIAKLTVVPGRMEQYFFAKQNLTFVVDYAHTPDALHNALQALQTHKQQGRVIVVFGCGGDRDKGKRPEMAKAAQQGADQVVIVDDNPRSENAQLIVEDIKKGLTNPDDALVIHDRKEAILHLLKTAQAHDIILVAGKGHEDYQIFNDKKVHYSDRECLTELIALESLEDAQQK